MEAQNDMTALVKSNAGIAGRVLEGGVAKNWPKMSLKKDLVAKNNERIRNTS